MRSSLRKLIGATTIATLVGMFGLAGVASAGIMIPGEGEPPDPGCNFVLFVQTPTGLVDYSTFTAGLPVGTVNATVVAQGKIPTGFAGAKASLLVGGATVSGPTAVSAVDGSFTLGPVNVAVPSDISVSYTYGNQNAYGNTCAGPGGVAVVRVRSAEAARALAFTGSSDTTRNVLIGVAALMVGAVLVVGSRRRKHVNA
ncbi:MAG: hypothetical protein ABWY77_00095 [Acidimicrobiia bacterium]